MSINMYNGIPRRKLIVGAKFKVNKDKRPELSHAVLRKMEFFAHSSAAELQFTFFRQDGSCVNLWVYSKNLMYSNYQVISPWHVRKSIKKLNKKTAGKYKLVKVS